MKSRVLMVSSDLVRDHGQWLLNRRSLQVREVANADEALSVARAWQPNLVIFSNQLGAGPVTEFCAALRAEMSTQDTKLLLLSESLPAAGDELPVVDGHLICPVDAEELSTTIGTLLEVAVRREPRVSLSMLMARLSGLAEDAQTPTTLANALNISASGMLLESEAILAVGARGTIDFYLPGTGQPLSLQCFVRGAVDELMLHYGIEFVDTPESAREQLQSFIGTRLGIAQESSG